MAMLLRTRKIKIALGLKIFTLLSVTLIYLISSDITDREQRSTHLQEGYGEDYNVRHLLSVGNDSNCTPAAIFDFPPDGFTRTQRQQGWVIIHASIACYLFILLAVVCDDYFVPAIKKFCDSLHMKEDIAGATFMATASSSPELFINCVGTFVTEGDLGVGTIVGSAVFNILAVPACCGLCANMVVQLEWWPISRDSMIYGIAVVLLITVLEDGKVHMYEALCLVLVYILYILMMCFNTSISSAMHKIVAKCKRRSYYKEIVTEAHPLLKKDDLKSNGNIEHSTNDIQSVGKDSDDLEESTKIWEWPGDHTFKGKCWWMFTWPISFILFLTTPDCRKYPKLYVMTFIMCVIWIGTTSYMVAWLITIIGDTLNIPDSVMGLTFLAAGTSVPEAVSSIIVTNQGHGGMGLSSSIGSNTFDILLCLGIPWFVKSAFYPKELGKHFIQINSGGLTYSAIALLATLVMFYSSLWINKFKLDWKVGLSCLLCYSGFLLLASLIELNYFMPVNFPTCDR